MSYKKAELLLAMVIIARATSLLIVKAGLGGFAIFNLMALRFVIAFFCLAPFVWRHLKDMTAGTLLRGGALGLLFFVIIALELKSLRMTNDAGLVAFLENTAIVLVPFGEALLHRRFPDKRNVLCALIALSGIGFLLLRGGRFALNAGVMLCMSTAVLYTGYIILTDRFSHRDDPLLLGLIAIGAMGLLATVTSFASEQSRLPQSGTEWICILLLAVVCSSIGTALQPVAQRYVPSEKACLFCALNPLSTCVMGWLFLNEWQGFTGVIGAALILVGIILSQTGGPAGGPKGTVLFGPKC